MKRNFSYSDYCFIGKNSRNSCVHLRLMNEIAWNFACEYTRVNAITLCSFYDYHDLAQFLEFKFPKKLFILLVNVFGIIPVEPIYTDILLICQVRRTVTNLKTFTTDEKIDNCALKAMTSGIYKFIMMVIIKHAQCYCN